MNAAPATQTAAPSGYCSANRSSFASDIHRRPGTLPRALGLEPEIPDAAAPRRDDSPDGAEVGPVRVLLVEAPDDVGRDADERAQRRRALDAVLAAVPGGVEHLRDLLQVVHEELLRLLAERVALASGAERLGREQLLELLRQRRLRDAAAADAEQLDLAVER